MNRQLIGRAFFLLTLSGCCPLPANTAAAAGHPLELPAALHAALEALRNGRYQQTLETSRSLQEEFPGHPLPFLIAAESNWGLIFCQTGHINSHEVWNSAQTNTSSFDDQFLQAVEAAIAAGKAMHDHPETVAPGAFYVGLAHGVRARLYTLRAEAYQSGREGKQMRESLTEAAALDRDLQADADAGLGAYNYYADVLSPLTKLFRFFLLIPGGDRELGLKQLRTASQSAVLVAPEARYELAKIYGLRENQPAEALALYRGLADQYPGNAIFSLSAAIQAERMGEKGLAADFARKSVHASAQMDDACRVPLAAASRQALERLTADPV